MLQHQMSKVSPVLHNRFRMASVSEARGTSAGQIYINPCQASDRALADTLLPCMTFVVTLRCQKQALPEVQMSTQKSPQPHQPPH